MEKFFKNINGDYISSISTGTGIEEITQEEYENILFIILNNRPIPEAGFDYRLRTDLTWELIEIPIVVEDDMEISHDEFMNMVEEVL